MCVFNGFLSFNQIRPSNLRPDTPLSSFEKFPLKSLKTRSGAQAFQRSFELTANKQKLAFIPLIEGETSYLTQAFGMLKAVN